MEKNICFSETKAQASVPKSITTRRRYRLTIVYRSVSCLNVQCCMLQAWFTQGEFFCYFMQNYQYGIFWMHTQQCQDMSNAIWWRNDDIILENVLMTSHLFLGILFVHWISLSCIIFFLWRHMMTKYWHQFWWRNDDDVVTYKWTHLLYLHICCILPCSTK